MELKECESFLVGSVTLSTLYSSLNLFFTSITTTAFSIGIQFDSDITLSLSAASNKCIQRITKTI